MQDFDRKARLQEYLMDIKKRKEQAQQLQEENKVSKDDWTKAAQVAGVRQLGSALQRSANAMGSIGGREADVGNEDFMQAQNQQDFQKLKARDALFDRGAKSAALAERDEMQAYDTQHMMEEEEAQKSIAQRLNDPASEESKQAREQAQQLFSMPLPENLSASKLQQVLPTLLKQRTDERDAKHKETMQTLALQNTGLQRQSRIDQNQQKFEWKQQQDLDKKTSDYSKQLAKTGLPEAYQAVDNLLSVMPEKGKDIPGVGILDGLKPDMIAGAEGRRLRQNAAAIFNVVLKDRSGAAVTDQELNRLRDEFGSGMWKTETQFEEGLAAYIRRLNQVAKSVMAGTDAQAKQNYINQGGSDFFNTMQRMEQWAGPAASQAPIQEGKKTFIPSTADELEE